MQVIDNILVEWRACRPRGVVLPIARLQVVLDRAEAQVRKASSSHSARQDAYALLQGSPSPLALLLCGGGQCGDEFIHFICFWQGLHELWRRLRQEDELDDEPIAEEVATFRDVLLRHFANGGVASAWLAEWAAAARNMSGDESAWDAVEAAIVQVASVTKKDSRSEAPLQLDELSALLFAWLQELVEDYCHGSRSAKIFCVQEVAGCRRHDACLQLSRNAWDVEAAIHHICAGEPARQNKLTGVPGTPAWSSGGAKLRRGELDCPICTVPYAEGSIAIMTHCCFQVLCLACHGRLTDARGCLSCPFCRGVSQVPCNAHDNAQEESQNPGLAAVGTQDAPATLLGGVFLTAMGQVQAARAGASRLMGEFNTDHTSVLNDDAEPQRLPLSSQGLPRRHQPSSGLSQTVPNGVSVGMVRRRPIPVVQQPPPLSAAPAGFDCGRQIAPALLLCAGYVVCSLCGGTGGS